MPPDLNGATDNTTEDNVQKTLVFCTALNTLEVSYISYLAESTETR